MSSLEKAEGPTPDLAGASAPDQSPETNDLNEVDRGAAVVSSPPDYRPERRSFWGRSSAGSSRDGVLSGQTAFQASEIGGAPDSAEPAAGALGNLGLAAGSGNTERVDSDPPPPAASNEGNRAAEGLAEVETQPVGTEVATPQLQAQRPKVIAATSDQSDREKITTRIPKLEEGEDRTTTERTSTDEAAADADATAGQSSPADMIDTEIRQFGESEDPSEQSGGTTDPPVVPGYELTTERPATPKPPQTSNKDIDPAAEPDQKWISIPADVVAEPPVAYAVDRPATPSSDQGDSTAAAPAEHPSAEGHFYEITDDGDLYPLDPITGDRLHSRVIPESLLADDQLREGFEFVQSNAHRMHHRLLLTPHAEASDLVAANINLRAEATELAQNNGVLFLEGIGTSETHAIHDDILNSLSRVGPADIDRVQEAMRSNLDSDDFHTGVKQQVVGTGVKVILPDYKIDGKRQADRVLHRWGDQVTRPQPTPTNLKEGLLEIDKWWGTTVGHTIYRNWYLIGKMGAHLATGRMTDLDGNIHSKLLVGANHRSMGEGWASLGVPIEYMGSVDPSRMPPGHSVFVEATRNGQLTKYDRTALVLGPLLRGLQ